MEKIIGPVLYNVHQYLVANGVLALQTEKDVKHKKRWIDFVSARGFELVRDTTQGKNSEYSKFSKRDQTLLIFCQATETTK